MNNLLLALAVIFTFDWLACILCYRERGRKGDVVGMQHFRAMGQISACAVGAFLALYVIFRNGS